jgi:hypothetical protein
LSAADALNRFYKKHAKAVAPKKRRTKNAKPEFELKKLVMKWLINNGFNCNVVESKAVFSAAAGGYIRGQTDAGFSDLVGVCPYAGIACFIELKAPGKRATLKEHQRKFLLDKATWFSFSVCVDSVELLESTYRTWVSMVSRGQVQEARTYLIQSLPVASASKDKDSLADISL